ncbi:hypothetical protein A11A3_02022 [Alcanivorax hongdengensis A-11-3]|uniref:Glycoside-hydrolase family GH114 TIM-barrel domain-containing protein n=1 Tax=Alcanivorax hongdengensis A-11-3 TaxID=1177179 RepID=L0WHI7_9GAMM|nr:endo alpha-1,4 polygalactosaminidase [Alcanivorax hongdengensis]EKF75607.1 hypothetical protein A11A3_02022 [Alcanivorax hongdengensis A-11-3]
MKFGATVLLWALLILPAAVIADIRAKAAAFYYGPDIPWHSLSVYDYPVVEPDQADRPPADGHRYYAYVSTGEVLDSRPYFPGIKPEWLLGSNPAWQSRILDQSNPALRRYFLDHVIAPLWQKGYRGFFLDTLDSYQLAVSDDAGRQKQRQGLVALIKAIGQRYPKARLILNRGFELLPDVADQVDAVAAESLYQRWLPDKERYQSVPAEDRQWLLGQFQQVRDGYGIDTIAIDYAPPAQRQQARDIAAKIAADGVIPWVTNPELDSLGLGVREVMPRKVLMIYGGSTEKLWELTDLVRYGLMPVQFQGLIPDIRSVDAAMPEGTLTGRYAGIVVWMEEAEQTSDAFEQWLVRQKEAGVPIAMLGYPAVDPQGPYGKAFGFHDLPMPRSLPVVTRASKEVGFESPLPKLINLAVPLDTDDATPWLQVSADGNRYTPVAMTPWGGYAFTPFVIRSALPGISGGDYDRWMIQPLDFIHQALQLPAMPIPDVTTENGRRLFFSHMDGDGFPSLAEVQGYRGIADARVMVNEIFKKYDVPFTVSIIEGEIAPDGLYPKRSDELEAIARDMYALPNVEAATHTYSHPFYWYESQAHPRELSGSEGLLRLPIPDYSMDPVREVAGSANYINRRLLQGGEKTTMVLWSGDTIPTPEALKAAREAGLLNMNGSDTTITRSTPTWTLVKGIGVPKGDEYQVYAPNQNENVYTHEWHGPFYGFERVIQTFEMTETPIRFKPVDVYFHTYIASKNASLESLRRVLDWATGQPLFPVFASEYVRKVLDFNDMVISREGDQWQVHGNGQLRTLRLPAGMPLPNLDTSQGLAGYRTDGPGRYLHMTGGQARWQAGTTHEAYLQQANGRLTAFQRQGKNLVFSLHARAPLRFALANATGCRLSHDGKILTPARRQGDIFHYRSSARGLNELRLQCSQ